jgi:uracil-DNA glycosylase
MRNELQDIIAQIKKHIEMELLAGKEEIIFPAESGKKNPGLADLKKEALSCKDCDLCETRTKVVFGTGNPKAKLMFVGEAPGMDEDLQGLPFVGRAGELLMKIIESIDLKRADVYIANVLKCRPPDNRAPLPTEILACERFLTKQIELVNPKVICALGKFAAQTLLRSTEPISKLRGKFYDYRSTKLMPTFHPAYLLRNPGDKRLVWDDMKKIRKVLHEHDSI